MNLQNSNTVIDIDLLPNLGIIHKDFMFGLFDGLVHDTCTEDDWYDFLLKHQNLYQIAHNGVFGGFFMIDDLGEPQKVKTCEVHAFILKEHRNHSTEFLKTFANFIFKETLFDVIVTSVPDYCPHVLKLLKRIGFKVMGEEKTQFTRNGTDINMTYLCLTIDNFGGI